MPYVFTGSDKYITRPDVQIRCEEELRKLNDATTVLDESGGDVWKAVKGGRVYHVDKPEKTLQITEFSHADDSLPDFTVTLTALLGKATYLLCFRYAKTDDKTLVEARVCVKTVAVISSPVLVSASSPLPAPMGPNPSLNRMPPPIPPRPVAAAPWIAPMSTQSGTNGPGAHGLRIGRRPPQ